MSTEEGVPAITLTDPNNVDAAPSPTLSPTKDAAVRPGTPSKTKEGRPDSAHGWTSPGRLIRSRSSHNANSSIDKAREEQANGYKDAPPPAMDPLSQHILKRTNAPLTTVSSRPNTADGGGGAANGGDARASMEQSSAAPAVQPLRRTETQESAQAQHTQKDLRKGVKAVSFISRLMGNKKKEEEERIRDDESVSNEGRPEGTEAQVFAQPVDNIGFSPRQPQPPAYIKMRSKNKKAREFDRVFLAQELWGRKRRKTERQNSSNKLRRKSSAPSDAETVWAMEFSRDGKYMAAAGADGIVRVWAVLSSSDDRQKHEKQESSESEANGQDAHAEHLSAPVFQSEPIREYDGHTSTVLDLSWSKNNFLLSSSMDKTVRLWHVSRTECLCTFKHTDFVPSIAFHPKDDRFFLAGSLDSKLRLWSIPDKNVAYTANVPDMITAVAFTPDGKCAMAGCLSGLCMFYETEGMKYQSRVHVRSTRGQNAKGSKITGIQAHHDRSGDVKLLITSNDSRVRLYNFRDKNLELKFRGNENNCSQIRASVTDDGKYVVCGSEDRKAYIWSMGPAEGDKRDRRPVEMFEAHDMITTVVCFAPTATRILLGRSEDPVYDLCNPPPVTLMSRAEREESQSQSQSSSRPPTESGSVQATPAEFEKPKESASYLARQGHKCGNIIVTADFAGQIKVFRQDCAWSKRKIDDGDRSSIFSKRNGRLSRTGSVMTRGSQPSLREGRTSLQLSGPSDRILSWRQGVASSPSINNEGQRRRSSKNTESRSISPGGSIDRQQQERKTSNGGGKWTGWAANVTSRPGVTIDTARARQSVDGGGGGSSKAPTLDSPRSATATTTNGSNKNNNHDGIGNGNGNAENPLMLQNGRSYMFWDTDEWKDRASRMQRMTEIHNNHHDDDEAGDEDDKDESGGGLRPPLGRGRTNVSRLSDELSSVESTTSEYDDAPEEKTTTTGGNGHGNGNASQMKCRHCGSLGSAAKKTREGMERFCEGCGIRSD